MNENMRENTNYWVCRKIRLAAWSATLSVTQGTIENLYRFADDLLAAGEKHAVLDVLETRLPDAYRKEMGISYTQFMRSYAAQTGKLYYLLIGGGASTVPGRGTLRVASRICYFDAKGQQVESEVANLGLLLRQIYEEGEYKDDENFESEPPHIFDDLPIEVRGDLIRLDELTDIQMPVSILFELRSDIWFPWVYGLNCYEIARFRSELYDNRLLANCHTPRLNAFLREARQLVEQYGGTWGLRRDLLGTEMYEWLINEDGIDLEWKYDEDAAE